MARELVAATGESITVATQRAIEERLDRVRRSAELHANLSKLVERARARPDLDPRTAEEIIGYDENGLLQ